jgi:spermidine/putrescine transport system permease protein/putrescine transport system permease protein
VSESIHVHRAETATLTRPAAGIAERPVTLTGRRPRRARGFDRPRFLAVFTALVFVYLFTPILVVFWYSFNSRKSTQIFGTFSLTWYQALLNDSVMKDSLFASIEIALATMLVAALVGTLLAFGLVRARSRLNRPTDVVMLLNLVSPEIVTAIALLLVFTQLGLTLSLTTVILGHITFSIAYVTIIVRARLASMNKEVEEAALDLGATNLQAVRLVTLPLLWPAVIASGLLVFVMSFDDFVTSYFVSGIGIVPLPVRIYSAIHNGVTPEINAVGTLMMVLTISIVLAALALFAKQRQSQLAFLAE